MIKNMGNFISFQIYAQHHIDIIFAQLNMYDNWMSISHNHILLNGKHVEHIGGHNFM
jgi:hypothetical protein